MLIDWESPVSEILLNPRYPPQEQARFKKIVPAAIKWPGHVWLSTSGSTSLKWVGISKLAILGSAQAVNTHLQSNEQDIWIQALPDFHIGGIGIWARSYLSHALVKDFKKEHKWNAALFYQFMKQMRGTLTALVPAQLNDLVQLGYESPSSLRAVIIGGGHLDADIYYRAIELGWKILPSYGLTECASQVATAEMGSWEKGSYPPLKILSHMHVQEDEGRIKCKGNSLLSAYAYCQEDDIKFIDPKQCGWFVTEDRGKVTGDSLSILGRADDVIKIGGESVDLNQLRGRLQRICRQNAIDEEMTLIAFPDKRLGNVIHLVITGPKNQTLNSVIEQFQQSVLPFEKIRYTHSIPAIPRSVLNKILEQELLGSIIKNKPNL
jgi:O-succinylbenzoic acid--CoA ligase